MLQDLRKHAQGWIAGIICGLIALAFALWGVQYYLQGQGNSQTVAKVNSNKISAQAFNTAYERLKRQKMLKIGKKVAFDPQQQTELKRQALTRLIDRLVLAKAAKSGRYYITNAQINSAIAQLPVFQENGQFSQQRFQQALSIMLYSLEEFYQEIGNTLLISQVQTGMTNSAFALPREVKQAAALLNQRRDFDYLLIPNKRFIDQVKVTQQAIKQYYQQHQSDYQVPEKISIAYVKLSADQIEKRLHITDKTLKQFYEKNLSKYSVPKQWQIANILIKVPQGAEDKKVAAAKKKIEQITKQIKAGKDFAELAKKYSQDQQTAKKGGQSGWFTVKQQSPALIQIISQLKPGQISAPYRNEQGYNLVKLIAVKPPKIKSFAQVRKQLMKSYRQQYVQKTFTKESDKLSELTYTNPNTLQPAAKALHLSLHTTGLFTRKGTKSGISSHPKIVNTGFSDEVLQQGNNSDLIQLDNNTVVVLRVKRHIPSTTKPLAAVKADIIAELKQQQASKSAKKLSDHVISDLQRGRSVRAIAKQYGLQRHKVVKAKRQEAEIDSAILAAAFNTKLPRSHKPNYTKVKLTKGYAVVAVTNVFPGKLAGHTKQQRSALTNELATNYGQLDYELYTKSIFNKTKINILQKNIHIGDLKLMGQ